MKKMHLLYRTIAAIAVAGYGYTGYLVVPIVWVQVSPMIAVCVSLSLIMSILIFLHDVLFGRSIFAENNP